MKGDDAGKALGPVLGTCNEIIGASERRRQKLMGAEDVETEPTTLLKPWMRKEGKETVVEGREGPQGGQGLRGWGVGG